ncbi:MAG: DUF2793 domain-containing protein [Pseudomonadota bacterium]
MPDTTTILSLPLILPAQAQKHVTHNEALTALDVIVQLAVINRDQTTPPALPVVGDRHIVPGGAIAAWAGQAGKVAVYTATGWQFVTALPGWLAFDRAEGKTVAFDGIDWALPAGAGGIEETPMLGINATADTTNRLSVTSPAVLLNHAGAGHQVKVNKAAATDTASLLFQTGFSGRAEMGTMGSDGFGIKVSATGASFATALTVAPASGIVSLPEGVAAAAFSIRDGADVDKRALFDVSGLPAGTTRTFALPNTNSELAALGGTQSFNGAKTFAGAFTVSGLTATFGSGTGNAVYGLGSGATGAASSKSINIGTGGVAGSATTVVIGSATAGATGSLTLHSPAIDLGPQVATFDMGGASARAALIGVGGATADATNRLAVTAPAVLFTHAGAGIDATLNKAAAGDTAAVSFKTGFSTRAQFGLLASDELALRVSPDGSAFVTAFAADAASGQMTLAQPAILAAQGADPASPANGALWHNGATGQVKARLAGVSRILDGQQDIPCLTPVAGEMVHTTTGAGGAATGTLAGAVGRMDLFPFMARAELPVDRLVVNCTTAVAAALAKLVVYTADANGRPDALLLETADLDMSTTGAKLATVALTFRQGRTYWLGLRHAATAAASVWAGTATPDINGGTAVVTTARKVLRRTLAYATPAPASWGFVSSDINAAQAPAIWLRMA